MIILKWLAVVMFAVALPGLGTLFITLCKGGVSPDSPTQPSRSTSQP